MPKTTHHKTLGQIALHLLQETRSTNLSFLGATLHRCLLLETLKNFTKHFCLHEKEKKNSERFRWGRALCAIIYHKGARPVKWPYCGSHPDVMAFPDLLS